MTAHVCQTIDLCIKCFPPRAGVSCYSTVYCTLFVLLHLTKAVRIVDTDLLGPHNFSSLKSIVSMPDEVLPWCCPPL